MFPTVLALIASYAIFVALADATTALGLDSHVAPIPVYRSGVTLNIMTKKGYFGGIDNALDKAAEIDGATPWQTFRFVFLPLAVPIMSLRFRTDLYPFDQRLSGCQYTLQVGTPHDAGCRIALVPERAPLPVG